MDEDVFERSNREKIIKYIRLKRSIARSSNEKLKTLYYAKGYLQEPATHSGLFSLDMLATAKQNGFEEGDLLFSYLCQKCKQSFPVSFKRCPNCMAINSVKVEEKIAKSSPKTDYSLL